MAREVVDVILKATGAEAVARDFDKVGKSAKTSGDTVEKGFTSKLQQTGSFVRTAMPGMLAVGGAAIAGFAVKAVGDFQDLALAAGKMADATGLSTEEASRMIEVFGDVGVSSDAVQGAIGKMNKAIGTNRAEFEKLNLVGGSTNETFTNVIEYLNGIQDPAERAREGTRLLGRSWMELAEVIEAGGADLKKSLAEVSDAQVIDEAEVEKARKFRDAVDRLTDSFRKVSLAVGESLVPALSEAFGWLSKISELEVGDMPLLIELAKIQPAFGGAADIAGTFGDKLIDAKVAAGDLAISLGGGSDATLELGDAAAGTADDLADARAEMDKMRQAAENVFDAFSSLPDALDDMEESLADAAKANEAYNKEPTADTLAEVEENAVKVAKAYANLTKIQAAGEGTILNRVQLLDAENASYLEQTRTLQGPAKQALIDRIQQLNGIPATKMTAISAAIQAGDLATAQRLLNEASRAREVAFIADAQNTGATNTELDRLARTRYVNYITRVSGSHAARAEEIGKGYAIGGVATGSLGLVGERGPELAHLPDGTRVHTASETKRMLNEAAGGGGGGVTYNFGGVTVVANDPQQLVTQLEEYARRNGRSRLQRVVGL